MKELDGKNILVTGSSSGIGAGTAVVLACHGANVVVNHRQSPEKAKAIASRVQEQGSNALVIQADVTDLEQVKQMVHEVLQTWQRIDVLVSNVGRAYFKRIEELRSEDWYRYIDVNLTSQFYCLQAILPVMLAQGQGKIIMLSSISAQRGSPSGDIAYSASKAGIQAMIKTLGRYYAGNGILVNGVAPGIIDTGMTDELSLERKAQIVKTIPLGRLGTAEEVGEMVAFLSSDRASYITGQLFAVNGGLFM